MIYLRKYIKYHWNNGITKNLNIYLSKPIEFLRTLQTTIRMIVVAIRMSSKGIIFYGTEIKLKRMVREW